MRHGRQNTKTWQTEHEDMAAEIVEPEVMAAEHEAWQTKHEIWQQKQ